MKLQNAPGATSGDNLNLKSQFARECCDCEFSTASSVCARRRRDVFLFVPHINGLPKAVDRPKYRSTAKSNSFSGSSHASIASFMESLPAG